MKALVAQIDLDLRHQARPWVPLLARVAGP
ncbi:hypothetical protein DEU38_12292 [Rhodococcus sp. AG1013]|nr:hypothetical protein DEU38_12292 [Rhodococcus sp. AG1013]